MGFMSFLYVYSNRFVVDNKHHPAIIKLKQFNGFHDDCSRYMASGKHVGKVLIKIREEEKDLHVSPQPVNILARHRFFCKGDSSYIVIGL